MAPDFPLKGFAGGYPNDPKRPPLQLGLAGSVWLFGLFGLFGPSRSIHFQPVCRPFVPPPWGPDRFSNLFNPAFFSQSLSTSRKAVSRRSCALPELVDVAFNVFPGFPLHPSPKVFPAVGQLPNCLALVFKFHHLLCVAMANPFAISIRPTTCRSGCCLCLSIAKHGPPSPCGDHRVQARG